MPTGTQILTDVPPTDLDEVVNGFQREGGTVTVQLQPDGNYTVTAVFPEPAPASPPSPSNPTPAASPPAAPGTAAATEPGQAGNASPAVGSTVHNVIATSFADPADVTAFRHCKAQGKTDEECFKVGDNGIGYWGDDTTGPTPMCALPPEDIKARWGSVDAGKHKKVLVSVNGRSVTATLADLMPSKSKITNGAGIDLSPAAVSALGQKPPLEIAATWSWA